MSPATHRVKLPLLGPGRLDALVHSTAFTLQRSRQVATEQSGDRSPHSKNLPENVSNLVYQALIFQILVFNYRELLKKFSLLARQ